MTLIGIHSCSPRVSPARAPAGSPLSATGRSLEGGQQRPQRRLRRSGGHPVGRLPDAVGEVESGDLLFVSSLGEPLCRFSLTRRIQSYGQKAGIVGRRVERTGTWVTSWTGNMGDTC
jgi:hypothetical protein